MYSVKAWLPRRTVPALPTSLRSVADGVASVSDGQTDRERAVRVHDVLRVTGDPSPAWIAGNSIVVTRSRAWSIPRKAVPMTPSRTKGSCPVRADPAEPVDTGAYSA